MSDQFENDRKAAELVIRQALNSLNIDRDVATYALLNMAMFLWVRAFKLGGADAEWARYEMKHVGVKLVSLSDSSPATIENDALSFKWDTV